MERIGPLWSWFFLREEILFMTKLTESSTWFVSGEFAGQLSKIEILEGDALVEMLFRLWMLLYTYAEHDVFVNFIRKLEKETCVVKVLSIELWSSLPTQSILSYMYITWIFFVYILEQIW